MLLSLAGFALLTTVVTAFCRERKEEQEPTSKAAESLGKGKYAVLPLENLEVNFRTDLVPILELFSLFFLL